MDKRQQIMQAALELFAKRGYHGTPVSLIAERAKVGSGTIYRYFKDKDDLVNTLYRHWKQIIYEQTLKKIDPVMPIRSMFHEVCVNFVHFAQQNPNAFIFMEAHHHSPYLDDASKQVTDKTNTEFLKFIQHGQTHEFIKPGPAELIKSVVFGIFTEMMKNHWSGAQPLTEELILQVEEMAWQAIRR